MRAVAEGLKRRHLDARREELEQGVYVAWHTALFTRRKQLPELAPILEKIRARFKRLTNPAPPSEPKTLEQHRALRGAVMLGQALMGMTSKKRQAKP